jgi:hypothetical protein
MLHKWDKLDVAIIMKGRHRFRWELYDVKGKLHAHGEAKTVRLARATAELAREMLPAWSP